MNSVLDEEIVGAPEQPDYSDFDPNAPFRNSNLSPDLEEAQVQELESLQKEITDHIEDEKQEEQTVFGLIMQRYQEQDALVSGLSDELKAEINRQYRIDENEDPKGPYGNGYYITLFGRTSPRDAKSNHEESNSNVQNQWNQQRIFMMSSGSETVLACQDLCVDGPSSEFETVNDSIRVEGRIFTQAIASFGAQDPVLVISIFDAANGRLLTGEVPIFPQEFEGTTQEHVAKFSKAIALPYVGTFDIVVSGFFSDSEGNPTLISERIKTVTKQGIPEIALVSVLSQNPQDNPEVDEDDTETIQTLQDGAQVSTTRLAFKIELKSSGFKTPLIVRNKMGEEDDAKITYSNLIAQAEPGDENIESEKGKKFYSLSFQSGDAVPLHPGLNVIEISATNPVLEQFKDQIDPSLYSFTFKVNNKAGGPQIKILSDLQSGQIVPQTKASGQVLPVQFCLTSIPSESNPNLQDGCVTEINESKVAVNVYLNGNQVSEDKITVASGKFTANLEPNFGINILKIQTEDKSLKINPPEAVEGEEAAALDPVDASFHIEEKSVIFALGNVIPHIKNGEIYENTNGDLKNTFTERGLGLNLSNRLLKKQLKPVIQKFLNDPERIKSMLLGFSKKTTTPGFICTEDGEYSVNTGDTSITFLEEGLQIGELEVFELEGHSSTHMLHLRARLNGLQAELNLKGLNSALNVTYDGYQSNGLALSLKLARLDLNVGVKFVKEDGILKLDLREIPGLPVVSMVGNGPLGNVVHVNSERNPINAGAEGLDGQSGLFGPQIDKTFNRLVLCGIEEGLNHPLTGALGKNTADLEKLHKYNQNAFRIAVDQDIELLKKNINLDMALNVLKGEIDFDDDGMHIRNIPTRFNPGPKKLHQIRAQDEFQVGEFGPLQKFAQADNGGSAIFDDDRYSRASGYNFGLTLSEDTINMALYAANLSGVFDLSIDPNFYGDAGITPVKQVSPVNEKLLLNADLNKNGLIGSEDIIMPGVTEADIPIRLSLETNKKLAPMLTFLSAKEKSELMVRLEAIKASNQEQSGTDVSDASNPDDPSVVTSDLVIDDSTKIFKIVFPEVKIIYHQLQPISPEQGGYKSVCRNVSVDSAIDGENGPKVFPLEVQSPSQFCPISASTFSDPIDGQCPEGSTGLEKFPVKNGPVIGGDPDVEGHPVLTLKGTLQVYGVFSGMNRQVPLADYLKNPEGDLEAMKKNLLRIRLIAGANQLTAEPIQVASGINPKGAMESLSDLLGVALNSDCNFFNEIRLPIPDRFPGLPENGGTYEEGSLGDTLCGFGIDHLSLGSLDPFNEQGQVNEAGENEAYMPDLFIDENGLYLDLVAGLTLPPPTDTCALETETSGEEE